MILKGNAQLWTLLDLKYRKYIKAGHGENGGGAKKTGKTGRDEILEVPLGTVIRNAETQEVIGEILEDKQELIILEGGNGGRGNWQSRSATRQGPDFSTPGGNATKFATSPFGTRRSGTRVNAVGTIQHAGRTTAVARSELRGAEDGRLYATGSTTCLIMMA